MDASKKENLKKAGVNVDGALERFMGNETMLVRYLNRFLTEKSYAALAAAVAADDQAGAAGAAHMLKSVCGTIGCDEMHDMVVAQESAMRAGDWDKAKAMMPDIEARYNAICEALRANI